MKTACIIQGNIRNGFELVLKEIQKHFDVVIVSTWEDEVAKIPDGDFIKIFNQKPKVAGYSHRNYQRYSTARGLEKAKELGCEYVMKWRTDMLPTKLDVHQLINWANYNVPNGVSSRIVTCAFRNLTVYEDWFSSMPDLFAFGHIDMMEMLWGDDGFDYTKMMNPPQQMLIDEGTDWIDKNNMSSVWNLDYQQIYTEADELQKELVYNEYLSAIWCAESEFYSIFKDKLQKELKVLLNHEVIVKNFTMLINHQELKIAWFGNNFKMRSIFNGVHIPWWTHKQWLKSRGKIIHKGYMSNNFIEKNLNTLQVLIEVVRQNIYFARYIFKNLKPHKE